MKQLIRQFSRFAVVGFLATFIDFTILYIIYRLFNINYLLASAAGFVIATIFNYLVSMRYIFKSKYKKEDKKQEFMVFLSLSIIGLVLTQLLMAFLVEFIYFEVMFAKIIVTGVVMLFNFVSRKLLLDAS